MDYTIESQPDYDFAYQIISGNELLGKNIFTADITFLRCMQGSADISLNALTHAFKPGSSFMLLDGVFFKVAACTDNFQMERYSFSIRFFNEIYPIIDNVAYDLLQHSAPDIAPLEAMQSMSLSLDKLRLLWQEPAQRYHHKLSVNLVLCFLYEQAELINKFVESKVVNTSNYTNVLIDKFFSLCQAHHRQHRQIEFYANHLNISPRYLQKIIKESMNSTPKQIVDYYVAGSAKRLLLTTALSNQQIADLLNFPEQTTFGQFFKRNVGMPPSEFRRIYK